MYKIAVLFFFCSQFSYASSIVITDSISAVKSGAKDSIMLDSIAAFDENRNQVVDSLTKQQNLESRFTKDSVFRSSFTADTLINDTNSLVKQPWQPKPRVAGLLSTILPGAGQVYNRNYWKPILIYGGAFFLGKYIVSFSKSKEFYRQVLILHDVDSSKSYIEEYAANYKDLDKIVPYTGTEIALLTEGQIQLEYDGYRSQLQNLYIFSVVWYGLNILDAAVEAHLKNFDVSDDLSLRIKPGLLNVNNSLSGIGPSLSFNFSIK